LNTASTCILHDPGSKRRITVAKSGSNTTVIWNPWESGAAKLPDLDPTEWHEFIAIETVNAATNVVTLAAGAAHVMQARVSVEGVTA
jgi:glucose-6-phosphate 1-epimerase